MPKPTEAMPSVIMKGDTPKIATPMPLTMPMRDARADAGEHADGDREHDRVGKGRWPCAVMAMAPDDRSQRQDRADRKVEAAGQQRQHLAHRDHGRDSSTAAPR